MVDNPSAGGGKIRPRRAAAARKPYSRATSQRKSLFSRVTDSVKSLLNPIAPKWLASRLGQEEEPQPAQRTQDADPDQPSTSVNHQEESYSRTNNNYKRSPLSRPPMKTTVSKTSISSLQYYVTPPDTPAPLQQVEPSTTSTGKEGLVKHLNMASKRLKLESGSPSLSDSSFIRNEMKLLSTIDNASVASSSGCSSSVQVGSQRTNTSDNEISHKPHWSSSMDSLASSSKTSSSRQQTTMTSHKRPRFNPAIFGMPSLGVNKYTDPQESSFYEGPVQFGGANASARSPYFASPYKIPSVTKVKVRHVNHQRTPARSGASISRSSKSPMDESSTIGMSSTAKKILQTLEKMSSPLNDARRIPTMTRTPSSFAADRRKRRTIAGSSLHNDSIQPPPAVGLASPSTARIRRRSHMPSNNSLLAKKTQEKQKDEPKPNAKVQVTEQSSSIRGVPAPIASMSSSASIMKMKSPPNRNETSGGGGKMKSQKRSSSHYSSMQEEEPEEKTPDLPNVPLPLSSLPSFNFAKSMMTSTPAVVRPQDKTDNGTKQPEFNFASPVIKTTNTEQTQSSANNTPKFQFSSPPTKASSLEGGLDTPTGRSSTNFSSGIKPGNQSLVFAPDPKVVSAVKAAKRRSSPLATPTTESSQSGGMRPAESLKIGSVMDILSGKTEDTKSSQTSAASKPPSSNLPPLKKDNSGWTCSVCMVQNDDTVDSCVACTTPKPGGKEKPPLSSVFGKKKGWDCGTCMVSNDADVEKCAACETPKPGSSVASKSAFGGSSIFKTGDPAPQTQQFSFGFVAKKDSESAAETSNSLSQKFKKAKGSWECGVCLVQNDASSTKCDACQTVKPGSTSASMSSSAATSAPTTAPKFKFGLPAGSSSSSEDKGTKSSGWGNLAKKSSNTWECEVCMVPNPGERKTCEACDSPKPGTKKEFNTSFKFGENSSGLFKFGLSSDKKTESNEKGDKVQETKKEQVAQLSTAGSQAAGKESNVTDSTPAKPSFSFGLPTNKAPTLSAGTTAPAPTFGAPAKTEAAATAPAFNFGQETTSKEPADAQTLGNTTKPQSAAATFNFGQKSTSTEPAQKDSSESATKLPTYSFAASKKQEPPSESSKPPVFGTQPAAIPTFGIKPQSSSSIALGVQQPSVQAPAAPSKPPFGGSVFGVPGSKPEEKAPAASGFTFGAGSTGGFEFGKSSEQLKQSTTSAASSPPTFNFGRNQQSDNKQPTPAFGLNTAAPTASSATPFAGFGAPAQQTQKSVPQTTEPPKAAFGFTSGQNTTASQKSGGIFGSSSSTEAAPSPFSTPASKPAFSLGSNSASAPFGTSKASGSANIFGNTAKQNSVFGVTPANSSQGPSSSAGVFGSSTNANSVFATPSADTTSGIPKPSFSFGSTNNNQTNNNPGAFQFTGSNQSAGSGVQFGSGSQQANNPSSQTSSGFNFGATSSKVAFSAAPATAPSGGFAFGGQSIPQSNGMFQFGAGNSQSNQDSTGVNKPFAFGSSNNSNPSGGGSSTGFNFGASNTPSFNFTGNQAPAFSSGDVPPNQNPFNQQARATTPNNPTRRRLQARRKLRGK